MTASTLTRLPAAALQQALAELEGALAEPCLPGREQLRLSVILKLLAELDSAWQPMRAEDQLALANLVWAYPAAAAQVASLHEEEGALARRLLLLWERAERLSQAVRFGDPVRGLPRLIDRLGSWIASCRAHERRVVQQIQETILREVGGEG